MDMQEDYSRIYFEIIWFIEIKFFIEIMKQFSNMWCIILTKKLWDTMGSNRLTLFIKISPISRILYSTTKKKIYKKWIIEQ